MVSAAGLPSITPVISKKNLKISRPLPQWQCGNEENTPSLVAGSQLPGMGVFGHIMVEERSYCCIAERGRFVYGGAAG